MKAKEKRMLQQQQKKTKYRESPSTQQKQISSAGINATAGNSIPSKEKTAWAKETNINNVQTDSFLLRVQLLSPLHLGSGQADVNVDAEVIHDAYGLPYFPAKRLKGLLYESALEVTEMLACCDTSLFTKGDIDELFQHGCSSQTQLILPNLYLTGYDRMKTEWAYLQHEFAGVFQPQDVLEEYTSLRYQTRIDRETGTAADTSLHNMRVVEPGIEFSGEVLLQNGTLKQMQLLAMAFQNLKYAGLKRNRGFGEIDCIMIQNEKDIRRILVETSLKEGGLL